VRITVDSVVIVDTHRYRAYLYITEVMPQGGLPALAEAGQHIVASPEFVMSGGNSIDGENQRNKNLLGLRTAKPGDPFNVMISLRSDGTWLLLDVINQ